MFWHLLKKMCGVNLQRLKKKEKNQHYEYVAFLQHSNLDKNTFFYHTFYWKCYKAFYLFTLHKKQCTLCCAGYSVVCYYKIFADLVYCSGENTILSFWHVRILTTAAAGSKNWAFLMLPFWTDSCAFLHIFLTTSWRQHSMQSYRGLVSCCTHKPTKS